MAFIKAVVAPSALSAFATFCLNCGFSILFYYSECCIARLYEKFGRAHVMFKLKIASFSDFLKASLVFVQYAAGGVAVIVALVQHSEGKHIGRQ